MANDNHGSHDADLPAGWAWKTIGDLVGDDGVFIDGDWVESKDQDPNGDVRLIQLADVGDGVYRNRSDRYLTSAKAVELGCTFLKADDVLVARMPDPLGRACIFPGDSKPSVTVVDVCIVRTGSTGVNHRWLVNFINAPIFRAEIASLQSGSTRKRISRGNLSKLKLPVPPIPEQHRIVAKIEEQFTRLDAGIAALKRAQANLKRYKAAVLKAACEGRLVAQDPSDEPASKLLKRILAERQAINSRGRGDSRIAPTDDLPELPSGWCWANIDQLTQIVTKGSSPNWQGFEYQSTGITFVRSQNIGWGALDLSALVYLPEAFNEKEKKSIIHADDVLLNIVGASIGRCAKATPAIAGGNLTLQRRFVLLRRFGYYYDVLQLGRFLGNG